MSPLACSVEDSDDTRHLYGSDGGFDPQTAADWGRKANKDEIGELN